MCKQSQGGKVRQSEKHLGSPGEWDRGDSRSAPEKGPLTQAQGKSRQRHGRKKRAGFGRNRSNSMDKQGMEMEKKLSYKVQIKEVDVHGHSST